MGGEMARDDDAVIGEFDRMIIGRARLKTIVAANSD